MEGQPLQKGLGRVVTDIEITLAFSEFTTHHRNSLASPSLRETTDTILAEASRIWQPKIVYRWLEVIDAGGDSLELRCAESGAELNLDLGFAIVFLKKARQALVGVYSVGAELDRVEAELSGNGQLLKSYLYDVIALELLEKVALQASRVAEEHARRKGWGVDPVLSPGSVHGWDLKDQRQLCSVLPLDVIGVEVRDESVLRPFKSVFYLIGVGPEYESAEVGSSCTVCSKRDDCTMRQDY